MKISRERWQWGMKDKGAISMIGGADGPTSVFIAGKRKGTLKERIYSWRFQKRKERVMKSLKANGHTLDQVADYIIHELGYREVGREEDEYQTEYCQMRASFLLQYRPDLVGEFSQEPQLKNHDQDSIKLFLQQSDQRQKAAEEVSKELFDIDLHIYERKCQGESRVVIEKRYGYIGGSASGSRRDVKKYNKIYKKIYLYYGVTQRDIQQHTERFEDVVRTLTM